jgi:hypothetical protein
MEQRVIREDLQEILDKLDVIKSIECLKHEYSHSKLAQFYTLSALCECIEDLKKVLKKV